MTLEDRLLARLAPTEQERSKMDAARTSLEEDATAALRDAGADGVAQVQGSVAKDTWIAGAADMDCFLLLSPDTPEDGLEAIVTAVAKQVLQDAHKKYAQHPYLIGTRDGLQVDLVPAYRIDDPSQRLSAVDRTPLHTAWVQQHLDDDAKAQVRLTKQWCKGVGGYGAETRIGGFSGYLIEVLVHQFGGFHSFLEWCTQGCTPRRIALGDDTVDDDVSPLVVVDPVDSGRNCAAAVSAATLQRVQEAAVAYQDAPDEKFYFPPPARPEPAATLQAHLADEGATWLGLVLHPRTDRLDLVFPQFQRAARVAAEALERAGFPVHRMDTVPFDDDRAVGMQWISDDATLAAERVHRGPAADREPNASRFRDKWDGHSDAATAVEEGDDGRLQVTLTVRDRTPDAWLGTHLQDALTGKHVVAALGDAPTVLADPADAPEGWAPTVADHILDRRPWQRP